MEDNKLLFAKKLEELITTAKKKKNVLEYQEVIDALSSLALDAEQSEKVFDYLEAKGIDILRVSNDESDSDFLIDDDDDIRVDSDPLQLFDRMLCRFRFVFFRTTQIWNQSHVNKKAVFPADFQRNLADCLQKGCDSMSPIVPPISVITTSASVCFPTR